MWWRRPLRSWLRTCTRPRRREPSWGCAGDTRHPCTQGGRGHCSQSLGRPENTVIVEYEKGAKEKKHSKFNFQFNSVLCIILYWPN